MESPWRGRDSIISSSLSLGASLRLLNTAELIVRDAMLWWVFSFFVFLFEGFFKIDRFYWPGCGLVRSVPGPELRRKRVMKSCLFHSQELFPHLRFSFSFFESFWMKKKIYINVFLWGLFLQRRRKSPGSKCALAPGRDQTAHVFKWNHMRSSGGELPQRCNSIVFQKSFKQSKWKTFAMLRFSEQRERGEGGGGTWREVVCGGRLKSGVENTRMGIK